MLWLISIFPAIWNTQSTLAGLVYSDYSFIILYVISWPIRVSLRSWTSHVCPVLQCFLRNKLSSWLEHELQNFSLEQYGQLSRYMISTWHDTQYQKNIDDIKSSKNRWCFHLNFVFLIAFLDSSWNFPYEKVYWIIWIWLLKNGLNLSLCH